MRQRWDDAAKAGELGLDLVGRAVEKDGTVKTDKRLATKVDGLWVAGDIRGGPKVRIGRFEMRHDGKAREIGETAGFIKVVVDAETGLILGASVLAVEGAELVHSYIQLMNAEVPFTVMENAIHIHPTLSEAVQSAVSAIDWN